MGIIRDRMAIDLQLVGYSACSSMTLPDAAAIVTAPVEYYGDRPQNRPSF
jgi:hypothetical protein